MFDDQQYLSTTGHMQLIFVDLEEKLKKRSVHCAQHIKDTTQRCLVLTLRAAR